MFLYIFSSLSLSYFLFELLTEDTTMETKSNSSLYKEWTENPEDVIEPTKATEVFVTVPSLLPWVDPYIDHCESSYNGKEYYGRGFHITDYSNFMKAFNDLPQRPKGKFWIVKRPDNKWMIQIRGLV